MAAVSEIEGFLFLPWVMVRGYMTCIVRPLFGNVGNSFLSLANPPHLVLLSLSASFAKQLTLHRGSVAVFAWQTCA